MEWRNYESVICIQNISENIDIIIYIVQSMSEIKGNKKLKIIIIVK